MLLNRPTALPFSSALLPVQLWADIHRLQKSSRDLCDLRICQRQEIKFSLSIAFFKVPKPGKSFGQFRHINQWSWPSSSCDGKVLVWVCQRGWKQPCQGGLITQQSPVAAPSLLTAPCQFLHEGKPQTSPVAHGNREQEHGSVTQMQRTFSFGCGITQHYTGGNTATGVKGKAPSHMGSLRSPPLAGPPAATGHWIPAGWGLSLGCPQGERGKGRKAAPLPPCMASSSDGCLGVPSLGVSQWEGSHMEWRVGCDGLASWFLFPHQPGTPASPGKPTWDLLPNYYSQNWSETHYHTNQVVI